MYSKCTEWCSHCETEVEISTEMTIQKCPNCGKYIIPCCMCDWDNTECGKCELVKICETKNKIMNNVERENVSKILNDLNVLRNFNYLYDRWQDEKEYEDFNEYANTMMKSMPNGSKLIKGTKRPFGVKFNYGGDIIQIYIKFEEHGKYCKLVAKIING